MPSEVLLIAAVLGVMLLAGVIVDRARRASHRKIVRAVGFPFRWLPIIERGLAVYRTLPYDLRERVQEMTFMKVNDLHFDGIGIYEDLTDEIAVSLGAHAGLLHANIRIPPIPLVRTVVVGTPEVIERIHAANPESWGDSTLVATWDPDRCAGRSFREERNPHIMATWRKLAPANDGHLYFAGWARALHVDSPRGRARAAEILPELGADALTFAAASEAFIRFPVELAANHPKYYEALRAFYRFDPARWNAGRSRNGGGR